MMTEEEAKNQSNPKPERTPGPWRTSLVASATSLPIYTDAAPPVLIGCTSSAGHQNMAANAAHIVHCVNTYDEVVGALDGLLSFMTDFSGYPSDDLMGDEEAYDAALIAYYRSADAERGALISSARAALAKAKGE